MPKTEPRTLAGFMELLPNEQILFEQMKQTIENVYKRFGFLPIDTPIVELSEVLLAKAGGETEKQIYLEDIKLVKYIEEKECKKEDFVNFINVILT